MLNFFLRLFSTDFMPHAVCLRDASLIDLHVACDSLIAVSYAMIPVALVLIITRRRDIVFPWMFSLFGVFIISCGLTHVLGVITLWYPIYRFDALIKAVTAISSLGTAILLFRLFPQIDALPSPARLRAEIEQRQQAESELLALNEKLEQRVVERTAELKQANEDLQRSKDLLDAVLDALPVAVAISDKEGRITRTNVAAHQMWGSPPDTGSWEQYSEWVGYWPETGERIKAHEWAMARSLLHGEVVKAELVEYERFDSHSRRFMMNNAAPVRNPEGHFIGAVTAELDVTEHRRLEQQLQKTNAQLRAERNRFRAVFMSAAIGVTRLSFEKGQWLELNDAFCRIVGYSREELIGRRWTEITHPRDIDVGSRPLQLMAAGEIETYNVEKRFIHKQGKEVWVRLSLSLVCDEEGRPDFGVCLVEDISERKLAEEAMRNSELRFRTLAEAVPNLLWVTDTNGSSTYISPRYQEFTGLPETTLLGDGWYGVVHPEDKTRTEEVWSNALRGEHPYEVDYRLRHRDGAYRWFVARAAPVRGSDGRVSEWIGSSTDVDVLKRTEAALRHSNEDLRQFAYAAAHDLQEPLRNVSNSMEVLCRFYSGDLAPEAMNFVNTAFEGSQRGFRMVKDLLRYGRIVEEAESIIDSTPASNAVAAALSHLQDQIARTAATIHIGDLPVVPVSETHLTQVFQNLISNSIKYAKDGVAPEVRISAQALHEEWQFTVSDNGIGFDPKYSSRIFGLFKRLHGREKYEGNGIGLALCSRIVACYGGRIWAESQPEQGAIFHFTLPLRAASNS